MATSQLLLFADSRPIVERLGVEFFRQAPQCPGVYLMRDAADSVVYVGKAKNLRQRLGYYRVANPDRKPRRHLRLLNAVRRIELEAMCDEAAALAREAALLKSLRPRFNRAGTWSGSANFFTWRVTEEHIELAVSPRLEAERLSAGPLPGAYQLLGSLARLLWAALHPERRLAELPHGWFSGRQGNQASIRVRESSRREEVHARLERFFSGHGEEMMEWMEEQTVLQSHAFERALRELDLEVLKRFAMKFARL